MADNYMYLVLIIILCFTDKLFSFLAIEKILSLKNDWKQDLEAEKLYMEMLKREYYPHLFDEKENQ